VKIEQYLYAGATALLEGKISKDLKKLLKKCVVKDVQEPLAVADAKLGSILKVMNDDAAAFLDLFALPNRKNWVCRA